MDEVLAQKLSTLPTRPGVYLMKDRQGEVVYVGKAVNLRSRVSSYFTRSGDGRAFIPLLEHLLGDVETLIVSSEKEALLLENELIKKHKPRFNVKLRDDKQFVSLRVDTAQEYPRIEVVRRFRNDGARYFGPYSSASSIRETLRIINRWFQLRTCTDHVLANRKRPCLLHQIGRCPAPCVYEVPREEYHRGVQEALLFLEGRGEQLTQKLHGRMQKAAGEQRYEDAARTRDQLIAIERSLEKQKVASTEPIDQDVFGHFREADRLVVYVLYIRQGRITGGQAFHFSGQEFPDEELLASFVNLYYEQENPVPDRVLLPMELEEQKGLEELLQERKGGKVRVLVPKRGEKHELLDVARKNAEQAFSERKRSKDETQAVLARLAQRLHLSRPPQRMECFDISHFQGATVVASQVAVTGGEVDKARYRRFRIKTVQGQDDFASMYEVITRRARRGLKEGDLPDLMVIDGGKGQLSSALAALKDLGVTGVDVVGLAKSRDLGPDTEGPTLATMADAAARGTRRDAPTARSPERVFLAGKKDPIVLAPNSPELFMLTRMRDEAHRFAITYQQKLMRRRNFRSQLEDVPGVGEGRKRALLRHFGSLRRIREASIEELSEAPGLGPAVAERIHAFLHAAPETGARAGGEPDESGLDAVRAASLEDAETPVDAISGSRPGER